MNEIEKKFADCLQEFVVYQCNDLVNWDNEKLSEILEKWYKLKFFSQYPEGIYIIDFVFVDTEFGSKYAIEIDGHEAHKTKEQRYADYQRERFLMKHGYTVVRYMGSEIFVDASKCVEELMDFIRQRRHDMFDISHARLFKWWVTQYARGENGGKEAFHNHSFLQHHLKRLDFKKILGAWGFETMQRDLKELGYCKE